MTTKSIFRIAIDRPDHRITAEHMFYSGFTVVADMADTQDQSYEPLTPAAVRALNAYGIFTYDDVYRAPQAALGGGEFEPGRCIENIRGLTAKQLENLLENLMRLGYEFEGEQRAMRLAVSAKSGGGTSIDEVTNLVSAEMPDLDEDSFYALSDRVLALIPIAKFDQRVADGWDKADAANHAADQVDGPAIKAFAITCVEDLRLIKDDGANFSSIAYVEDTHLIKADDCYLLSASVGFRVIGDDEIYNRHFSEWFGYDGMFCELSDTAFDQTNDWCSGEPHAFDFECEIFLHLREELAEQASKLAKAYAEDRDEVDARDAAERRHFSHIDA